MDEQKRSARVAKQSPFDRADHVAETRTQSESDGGAPQLGSAETGFQPEAGDSPASAGRSQLERALRTTSLPQAGAGICRAAIAERAANAAASASDESNELSDCHSDDAYFASSAFPGLCFPVAQWGRIERHSTRPRTTPPTRMFSTVSIWTGMFVCVICVLSIGAPLRDRPAIKDGTTSRSRPGRLGFAFHLRFVRAGHPLETISAPIYGASRTVVVTSEGNTRRPDTRPNQAVGSCV